MNFKYILAAIFFAFALSTNVLAEEPTGHSVEGTEQKGEEAGTTENGAGHEKFNAGKLIIDHITDSHEWHLWGSHENPTSIYLPVILYTPKGIDVFSSGHLKHHEIYEGKNRYQLHENHIAIVDGDGKIDEEATGKVLDFSITKNVVALFFSAFLLFAVFLSAAAAYKKRPNQAPKGIQSFFEPVIVFVRDDIARPCIGKKYERYMPFLLTAFFFIWFNNMLGIIPIFPAGANITGNIAVTGFLALVTFVITLVSSNRHYWHHILAMPGVPKAVLIILTPIEIMGLFLRPFVLMIRLFANITAGHIIALSFLCLIFIFGEMSAAGGFGVGIFSVLFNVFMGLMELLVALIQAYVFTLLSAIYIGTALEEPHH